MRQYAIPGVAANLLPERLKRKMPHYPSVPAVRLGLLAVAVPAEVRKKRFDSAENVYPQAICWNCVYKAAGPVSWLLLCRLAPVCLRHSPF